MKTTILKSVITVLVALVSLNTFAYDPAYDVQIDGIYYNLDKEIKTAKVAPRQKGIFDDYKSNINAYTGEVIIPQSIISDGIEYSVVGIDDGAFSSCTNLTSVNIPESVTSIGRYAFEDCSGLTSVTIPEGVTSIGSYAFSGCSGLTSVTIPEGVTSIGAYAFRGCSGLTSVTIPESVTSIGEAAFRGCSGLTSVTIPESVTSIGGSAFSGCYMNSIILNEGLLDIGTYAFSGNNIVSITIPSSVQTLSGTYGCFDRCSQLQSVIFLGTTPPSINQNWLLYGTPNTCKIYVPDESMSAYEAALRVKNEAYVDRLTPMSQLPTT